MSDTLQLKDHVCVECGAKARMDARFVQWCTDCGHGADPGPAQPGRRAQRAAERERQRSLKLFESLRTAPDLRPTSAIGVAVTVLAAVVHLSSLALLVLPVLLVIAVHEELWSCFVLVLAWMVLFVVRPRFFGRRPDPRAGVDRSTAPALYALLDRCAAELGCETPEYVRFDARFNASTGRAGVRRTSFLFLGLPLWSVLSGPERIALLGHELAHQVNGDTTHGLWAASARRTISEWTRLLDPRQSRAERVASARARRYRRGGSGIAGVFAPVLMAVLFAPFFLFALGCRAVLTRLDLYCGQRAEYLADELGARLAGSAAAHGCMAALALGDAVLGFLTAARNRQRGRRAADAAGLWASVAQYVDSVPETERQRRLIVDRLHNTRTDRSHPANHLRLALLAERPQVPAALTVTDAEWAAVDAELAPGHLAAARAFLG
ncbi:MAG TPA: M48 family metallopeptidase [Actinospica sp.]|nr:M48 family metallopeptidase [Actinospica sp.]